MIAFVSSTLRLEGNGVLTVESLSQVQALSGVDIVVIHSFSENNTEAARLIQRIGDTNAQIYYIRSADQVDDKVKLVVQGVQGEYIDDEFYLESSETLVSFLSSSSKEIVATSSLSNMSILLDFLRNTQQGNSFTPEYLSLVTDSTKSLVKNVDSLQKELVSQASTAVNLFTEVSEHAEGNSEKMQELQEIVNELEERVSSRPTGANLSTSEVWNFPPVSFKDRMKRVVVLKDIGFPPYAVSFAMGAMKYASSVLNLRPRLVIIVNNTLGTAKEKLSQYPLISSSEVGKATTISDPIVVTNYPMRSVIEGLARNKNYDVTIILDSTNLKHEPLVTQPTVHPIFLIKSAGDITKYKLPKERCISFLTQVSGTLGTISALSPYSSYSSARESAYINNFSPIYKSMFVKTGIKGQ